MIICVDAGHGGSDPGAIGCDRLTREADLNLLIALSFGQKVASVPNATVIYTRTSDKFIPLQERCNIANAAKANVFISFHFNSSSNPMAKGTESLVYSKINMSPVVRAIAKTLPRSTGLYDRGVIERKNVFVLRRTSMPSILLETGFLSNGIELGVCKDPRFIDKVTTDLALTLEPFILRRG